MKINLDFCPNRRILPYGGYDDRDHEVLEKGHGG